MTCNRCDRKAKAGTKHCGIHHAKLAEYRRRHELSKQQEAEAFERGVMRIFEAMKTMDSGVYDLTGWTRDVQTLATRLKPQ